MNSNINSRKHAARKERLQQRMEGGLVNAKFPEVASIIITMTYNQKGIGKPMPRTINFAPDSFAFFKVDCLNKECVDGGFDLTREITAMVGKSKKTAKGELVCVGADQSESHSDIKYEVAIQYT